MGPEIDKPVQRASIASAGQPRRHKGRLALGEADRMRTNISAVAERLLGGLVPARWLAPTWRPAGEQLVLINWLYNEIDALGQERWPILKELHGWRNIEVHEFVSGPDTDGGQYAGG